MRGRGLLTVVILLIVSAGILFFRVYDGKPGPLPSENQILTALNTYNAKANAAVVLDIVKLTEKQIYIPFVSSQGNHGMGFLKWEKRKWSVARVDISGRPEVRVTDHSNPSDRYLVWNIDPLEKMKELRFYLIRERNAGMTSGRYYYDPRVQMEMLINMTEHPYGAIPYPAEWAEIIRADNKLSKQSASYIIDNMFMQLNSQLTRIYVGYLAIYADDANNLSGFSKSGDKDMEFLMIINETDLEKPR